MCRSWIPQPHSSWILNLERIWILRLERIEDSSRQERRVAFAMGGHASWASAKEGQLKTIEIDSWSLMIYHIYEGAYLRPPLWFLASNPLWQSYPSFPLSIRFHADFMVLRRTIRLRGFSKCVPDPMMTWPMSHGGPSWFELYQLDLLLKLGEFAKLWVAHIQ